MSRRKQQEGSQKALRELLSQPSNKKCLECDQRGPTYVDVTIGSFVCTSCGGILRGLNPPHRIKSISMTNFTPAEITFIESRGNEWCRAVYLAKYDEQSGAKPDGKADSSKLKQFMELKYEQKRWYESPTRQRKLMESAAAKAKKAKENAKAVAKPVETPRENRSRTTIAPPKQPSTNLLDGISFSSPSPAPSNSSVQTSNSTGFSGFADFDKAFAELSTSQNASSNQQDPFAAFEVSSQPIDFTNASSKPAASMPTTKPSQDSGVDKYAALADLDLVFKVDNPPQKTEPLFSTSSSSISQNYNQPPAMAPFGNLVPQSNANSLFATNTTIPGMQQPNANSLFATNSSVTGMQQPSSNSLFATSSTVPVHNPTVPDTSSNFGSSTNWNTPFQAYTPYQPNPSAASATNPFFSATQSSAPVMQNWSQPLTQGPGVQANSNAFSSTNPFNIGGPTSSASNFKMSQGSNPAHNPSNPFMFS